MTQYHVVENWQRDEWEQYSVENQDWVENSIAVMKQDQRYYGKIVEDYFVAPTVHDRFGNTVSRDDPNYFVLPKWQSYPTVPIFPPFNWNGRELESMNSTLHQTLHKKQVVIAAIHNLPVNSSDPEALEEAQGNTAWLKDYIEESQTVQEPISDIYYPILTDAADVVSTGDEAADQSTSSQEAKTVAIFGMTFFWSELLKNVFPEGAHAFVVVFDNTCGQQFSYEVVGGTSTYLGPGDLHDSKFDGMVRRVHFLELAELRRGNYLGVPLSDEGCLFSIRTYPSLKLEEQVKSNDPIVFSIAAAMIFVFATAVFLVYDSCVERRQVKYN